ncbi:MAG: PD-(D/E)XK motif protein [Selenomonadaceae bacterium]|nr:PD-(D/E)XK motif protein [Selenomonadaceae bacterium]
MIDFENLRGQWEKTLRVERGYTFVDTTPLECYIGYDEKIRRTLLILTEHEIKIPPSSKTVEIKLRKRKDGGFNLSLTLLCENETAVFVEMCRDLLNFSEAARDEKQALKNFWQRYEHWQNLFAAAKNDLLSNERQRGLIGELLFLREQIINGRPLKETVAGWVGALKEHQDFSYGEIWYEIKTVSEQAEKVRIPSLEQLSLERKGELIIYRLGNTSGDSSIFSLESFTLNSLAKNLSELLSKNSSALQRFEVLLFQAGYIEREEYDDKFYRLAEVIKFVVDEKFPRLTKNNLPSAIIEASYSLNLRELQEEISS